jgi:hypothetical protein
MTAPSAMTEGTAARLPRAPRRAWLLAVLACVAFFLFTDKSRDTECIHNVTLYGVAALPHNCDSLTLEDKLWRADLFYTQFHNWKDRPLYQVYGVIAGSALVPVAFPLWAALQPGAKADKHLRKFAGTFNFHLAYFLLNIAVVAGCAWIAIRIAGLDLARWPAVGLAAAIASSDLVHGGVWLMHTNIFNLVSAFGALLFVVLGLQRAILPRYAVFAGALLIGCGALTYPALILIAPAYVAGCLLGRLALPAGRPPLAAEAAELLAFAGLVALPLVAWWMGNRMIFETATYLTAEKGQFSWAPQAWAEGALIEEAGRRLVGYFGILAKHSAAEYLLSLGSIAFLALRGGRTGVRSLAADPVVWSVLVAMLGVLGFNFLQGYYAARLNVAAAYLLYVVVARFAASRRSEALATFCLFAIAAYQLADAALGYAASGD